MDGVALQAAHHLGAPRRRLPSHVSKRPRILLLLLLLLLAPRTGRLALFGFAFATVFVRLHFDSRAWKFLRVRKGLSVLGQSTRAASARDTTRCCNGVRAETAAMHSCCFLLYMFFFSSENIVFGLEFSGYVRRKHRATE